MLVEDILYLLPVKFRQISFSRCREVENVSVNQAEWAFLFSPISPNNKNLVGDVEYLLPIKFRNAFSEKSKMYRAGRLSTFSYR